MSLTQDYIIVNNYGTSHAISAHQFATNNTSYGAANFTSANEAYSCAMFSGVETGRGTVKIAHSKPPSGANDANASALSIFLKGVNTACQGIHIDTESGTSGALIDARDAGIQLMKLTPDGVLHLNASKGKIVYDL